MRLSGKQRQLLKEYGASSEVNGGKINFFLDGRTLVVSAKSKGHSRNGHNVGSQLVKLIEGKSNL